MLYHIDFIGSETTSITTFDNVKLKKCNGEQHVITKVVNVLKKKGRIWLV